MDRYRDRHEIAYGEHTERARVVTGEEMADLPHGWWLAFSGEIRMGRRQFPEDQQVDQREGHDHGEHPGDVDAGRGEGSGDSQQQDDLDDAERPVLDRDPYRAPESREDSILKREDTPCDDAADEEERGDHAAELGVGGPPVADRDQEQGRDEH